MSEKRFDKIDSCLERMDGKLDSILTGTAPVCARHEKDIQAIKSNVTFVKGAAAAGGVIASLIGGIVGWFSGRH